MENNTIHFGNLGDPTFRKDYGLQLAYMGGAMANQISSIEMVAAFAKAGCLGSFGSAGLSFDKLEESLINLKQKLAGKSFAVNLIHSPGEEQIERKTVDFFVKHNIHILEASAFIRLSPSLIAFRASGLSRSPDGKISIKNKVIAKISRSEVASKFMQPPSQRILNRLVEEKRISREQADLARFVPVADDITVEADSGGHTDNRPLVCLLPDMLSLRDEMQQKTGLEQHIRIGAGGGISTPASALAAFIMGAAYIVTGTVNQACIEAGVSEKVREKLARARMTDVIMVPAADMFELGVKVQVLKTGTLFPMRAHKLYELYTKYDSMDEIPDEDRKALETQIFHKKLDDVWQDTRMFFSSRDPIQIEKALENPRQKMALIFRWYLGLSSKWACEGIEDREKDYQIWCGPSMGAFNTWVKGTYLEDIANRQVADVALHIMKGAEVLLKGQLEQIKGGSGKTGYKPLKKFN